MLRPLLGFVCDVGFPEELEESPDGGVPWEAVPAVLPVEGMLAIEPLPNAPVGTPTVLEVRPVAGALDVTGLGLGMVVLIVV